MKNWLLEDFNDYLNSLNFLYKERECDNNIKIKLKIGKNHSKGNEMYLKENVLKGNVIRKLAI